MLAGVMVAEGQSITIQRGPNSVTLVATPDEPQEGEIGEDGLTIHMTSRMFAINAADMGVLETPRDGDRITWGALTFLALPINGGRCYESLDNRNLRISIHAKRVAT